MKKILSWFLACILCVIAIPNMAFADTEASDNLFGVITDAEGNIVEVLTMPKTVYVDSIHTIPAGGSFVSYQYEPNKSFTFGFLNHDESGKIITEYGRQVELSVEMSDSIGGGGRDVFGPYTYDIYVNGDMGRFINPHKSIYNYRYFNGKIINKSSLPTTIRIMVAVDQDELPYNM